MAATASSPTPRSKGIYRDNLFRDLRFAVHYMYTNDSEVSGNISIGNHLGFAIMFSDRVDRAATTCRSATATTG